MVWSSFIELYLDAWVLFFFPSSSFFLDFCSTSPSRVDGCFFCSFSFFGAGDLWIRLGYRVYILDSRPIAYNDPTPSLLNLDPSDQATMGPPEICDRIHAILISTVTRPITGLGSAKKVVIVTIIVSRLSRIHCS